LKLWSFFGDECFNNGELYKPLYIECVKRMPKRSKKQIDEDENKIIIELKENSKKSIDKIAEKCNFSRQKVWRTIKRLEDNKTIWGYTAITDDEKQNLKHYTVLVKRSTHPFNKDVVNDVVKGSLEDRFKDEKISIRNILFVHGEYDWIITFTAPDIKMMKRFCEKMMEMFGDYISDYKVLETIIPIRREGIKYPNIEKQAIFL